MCIYQVLQFASYKQLPSLNQPPTRGVYKEKTTFHLLYCDIPSPLTEFCKEYKTKMSKLTTYLILYICINHPCSWNLFQTFLITYWFYSSIRWGVMNKGVMHLPWWVHAVIFSIITSATEKNLNKWWLTSLRCRNANKRCLTNVDHSQKVSPRKVQQLCLDMFQFDTKCPKCPYILLEQPRKSI